MEPYTNRTVITQKYNARLKKVIPGGVHYNFHAPSPDYALQFNKGLGNRLWDLDGNEYLDLFGKFGALILGHGNPEYKERLKNYIDKVLAVNNCDIDAEASELLIKNIPSAQMIRYGLSGTEIVLNALRLARGYTGKDKFIRFESHYHGNADSILGGKVKDYFYPVPEEFVSDVRFTKGQAKNSFNNSFLLPWNDIKILKKTVNKYKDEIAAIITEPICINGGGMMPKPGYLEGMRKLCDENKIVLIFDEIITGFRVGLHGAQELLGIIPDLTIAGKCIAGGGLPVSALAGKKEMMDLYTKGEVIHAGTFNGYPLGLAAVKATIEILSQDNGSCYSHMEKITSQILEIFKYQATKMDIPIIIQGHPLCPCVHIRENPIENANDLDKITLIKGAIINYSLAQFGILLAPTLRIFPSIRINESDVRFFEERIHDALSLAKLIFNQEGV